MPRELVIHTTAKDIRVTLDRRGDGQHYHAAFWHRGIRHRESTHSPVLAKAQAEARRMVLDALEAMPASGGLPISSAVIQYLDARFPPKSRDVENPRSPDDRNRTFEDCRTRLNAFAAICGADTDLALLTYDQAVAMTQRCIAEKKQAGNGARSQGNMQSVLSAFYRWLLRTRERGHGRPLVPWKFNPACSDELELDKADGVRLPALTDAEVELFIACARDTGKPKGINGHNARSGRPRAIWPIVLLCLGAGARPIEALRLKWGDVNWDRGTIVLRAKKRTREIKLSAWCFNHLRELCPDDYDPEESVCGCNADAKNLRLKRLRQRFNLPAHFNFQALRRTAARKAAPKMSTYQYAKYFGHSLAVAEQHYLDMGLVGDSAAVNVLTFEPPNESATKTATPNEKASA